MITGMVTPGREPVFRLTFYDSTGVPQETDAVMDTGFTGWLTLPPSIIATLGVSPRRSGRALLADGSEIVFDVYEVEVLWDGQKIAIPVNETDAQPLMGMSLIYGYELLVQAVDGGLVTLRKL